MINKLRAFLFPPSKWGQIAAFAVFAAAVVVAAFLVRWGLNMAALLVDAPWLEWAAFAAVIFAGFYIYAKAAWK